MASIKYKTEDGYVSIPLNIIGSRVYLEDYDDGEVVPELVDDSAKIGNGIGTCSTSSGTALEVTLDNYKLVKNGIVAVTFENDVPANATLNINNKGAKPIYNEGSAIEADVIKAGKTVMFAYDGTNYVVTSLGGGESVEFVEYLSINLISDYITSDPSLIGATVVVTDDVNSETIFSTTWQGTTIETTINIGTHYTITVGSISGYDNPSSESFVALPSYTRTVDMKYIAEGIFAIRNDGKRVKYEDIGNENYVAVNIKSGIINFMINKYSTNGTTIKNPIVFSSALYGVDLNYMTNISASASEADKRTQSYAVFVNGETGIANTNNIINDSRCSSENTTNNAAKFCANVNNPLTGVKDGYLGSLAEWFVFIDNITAINNILTAIGGTKIDQNTVGKQAYGATWTSFATSTESDSNDIHQYIFSTYSSNYPMFSTQHKNSSGGGEDTTALPFFPYTTT